MYLTALFDEAEPLRHGMAARIVVNVLTVMGGGIVAGRAWGVIRSAIGRWVGARRDLHV